MAKVEERTAGNDAEEDTKDKVPDGHHDHDARNCGILHPADTVSSVPESFFDEVDAEDEDECSHNHDSYCRRQRNGREMTDERTNIGDWPRSDKQEDCGRTGEHETRNTGVPANTVKPRLHSQAYAQRVS